MAWAMDGTLDAAQLWALDGYKGLPRVELDYPVVSMDEPDAICFVVCEDHHEKHGDETTWRIMVDMKSKTLGSVFRYPDPKERRCNSWKHLVPSRVSKYFNSKPSSGQTPGPAAQAEAMQNLMSSRINNKLQAMDTMQAASLEVATLAALQEIPGLDRDDMLKAYLILILPTTIVAAGSDPLWGCQWI
ncbi:unnamed protein product [Miscanthus lutarioriparius]|uniref:Uncharacterized protein n=1 Tax=Miscanthus lutarioriparius TaxID=422564 RepID=A0A811SEI8_9POAL|nr:unnamed protein product [Miscanthus lutarioriparius]